VKDPVVILGRSTLATLRSCAADRRDQLLNSRPPEMNRVSSCFQLIGSGLAIPSAGRSTDNIGKARVTASVQRLRPL
jgi:hypothetical protein